MSAAACKAAECSITWNQEITPRERHLRAVASHPEFTAAIGQQFDRGGKEGKHIFEEWVNALENSPMDEPAMNIVQGIIDNLTGD